MSFSRCCKLRHESPVIHLTAGLAAPMSNPSAGACPMRRFAGLTSLLSLTLFATLSASAAPRKTHSVVLGAIKRVSYSKAGDPSGAATGEDTLKVRALLVDGVLKEWTTGDAHDVTDRSFVVRRVIRLNDALPTDDKPGTPEKA